MKSRGMSGFSAIIMIILLVIIGYVIYQIAQIHFTYGSISEKVKNSARIGHAQNDYEIIDNLIREAKELNVELITDSIFIDHSITDSFRIYVVYRDSTNIFGFYTYSRRFVIDKVEPIMVRF